MKAISIPDIHGRQDWKGINPNSYDLILFIGDYADSYPNEQISDYQVINNLYDIICLKKKLPQKVILLIGNHDLSYLYPMQYFCSRYNPTIAPTLNKIFSENKEFFQMAYQYKNYLWTHAGISNFWYNKHKTTIESTYKQRTLHNLAECLNYLNNTPKAHILHEIGRIRGGIQNVGGPTWADKKETENDPLINYKQIAGHSRVKDIVTYSFDKKTSITYIDCLWNKTKFLTMDI